MLRDRLLRLLRGALGTQQILDVMRSSVLKPRSTGNSPASGKDFGLTLLEGSQDARYAVPIEYLPSRDYKPRYGNTHPPIPSLESWFASYAGDYRAFIREMRSLDISHIGTHAKGRGSTRPAWTDGAICAFDALALYAMVRKARPKQYLEIGSGMSTCFVRQAIFDARLATRIVSLDPEPRSEVDAICDESIRASLETCDLGIFDGLEPGDVVFFDGSHRAFMNSDVTVFFIDVLPLLKPGVIVHVHDVSLPYDYPDSFKTRYWNEQYLLAVYLMGNQGRIRPLLPTAFICNSSLFENDIRQPFVDLGAANDGWRGGGSMWFTHA